VKDRFRRDCSKGAGLNPRGRSGRRSLRGLRRLAPAPSPATPSSPHPSWGGWVGSRRAAPPGMLMKTPEARSNDPVSLQQSQPNSPRDMPGNRLVAGVTDGVLTFLAGEDSQKVDPFTANREHGVTMQVQPAVCGKVKTTPAL
jgi:hypothetical protein